MMTPTFAYILTWLGLSFLYFWYWNQRPPFSTLFVVVGAILLVVCLFNALGVIR